MANTPFPSQFGFFFEDLNPLRTSAEIPALEPIENLVTNYLGQWDVSERQAIENLIRESDLLIDTTNYYHEYNSERTANGYVFTYELQALPDGELQVEYQINSATFQEFMIQLQDYFPAISEPGISDDGTFDIDSESGSDSDSDLDLCMPFYP